MKKFRFLLFVVILGSIPFLQSCLDDDDDSDHYSLAIATLKINQGKDYYLLLDDNSKILPSDTSAIHSYKIKDGQRVLINYTVININEDLYGYNYSVRLNSISDVLTKKVIELNPANADSIGDDNIEPVNIWIGSKYLNIEFQMLGSNVKPHMVNLVSNVTPKEPEDGYASLEFRHNFNGDDPTRLYSGIVSFDLEQLAPANNATLKGLKLRVKTISSGEKFYKITFNRTVTPTAKGVEKMGHTDFKIEVQ